MFDENYLTLNEALERFNLEINKEASLEAFFRTLHKSNMTFYYRIGQDVPIICKTDIYKYVSVHDGGGECRKYDNAGEYVKRFSGEFINLSASDDDDRCIKSLVSNDGKAVISRVVGVDGGAYWVADLAELSTLAAIGWDVSLSADEATTSNPLKEECPALYQCIPIGQYSISRNQVVIKNHDFRTWFDTFKLPKGVERS